MSTFKVLQQLMEVRLRCRRAAKAVSEKPRRSFENKYQPASACLVVLRQSRPRREVKSSDLAERAVILTVLLTDL